MLTAAEIEIMLCNGDRKPIEITRDLCQLESRPISLTLEKWKFQDWRPRDEWFQIVAAIEGTVHRLRLVFSPHDRLDARSSRLFFVIGPASDHPKIHVEGIVSGNSTLSTGLYVDILHAHVDATTT